MMELSQQSQAEIRRLEQLAFDANKAWREAKAACSKIKAEYLSAEAAVTAAERHAQDTNKALLRAVGGLD